MSKSGGHHGGAWKVAYADFTTAMMALFLCLWLTAQDSKIKEAVERAFRNPFISLTKEGSGLINTKIQEMTRGNTGSKESMPLVNPNEIAALRRLQEDLNKALRFGEDDDIPVQMNLTDEGLRITIFDRARRPVFEPDSIRFTDYGTWILSTLAWQIAQYRDCAIEVEGHTERGHKPRSAAYGNWELSSDRANAGRRKLIEHGVREDQVRKVAGYADTVPLVDSAPEDEVNRRITLLVRVRIDLAPRMKSR